MAAASSAAASAGSRTSSRTASGFLVAPEDATALADALVRVLSTDSSPSLGAAAHAAVQPWLATPEEYARGSGSSSTKSRRSPAYTHAMRADRAKQLLKNGVYRAIGETVTGRRRARRRRRAHAARADVPQGQRPEPNPTTVPTRVFAEQMTLLAELGYSPSRSTQVRAHYVEGAASEGAVLITFDDGYRDNLENALPILLATATPAVIFVPIGFLDGDRPASARGGPARARRTQRDGRLGRAGGARGRRHSRRVARDRARPVSELEPGEAAREIALSKLRLEERLGRAVEAYAFVKGSLADYRPEHVSLVQQAGYTLGFTSVSGANGPRATASGCGATTSSRIRRERSSSSSGACDLISVKDTVPALRTAAFNKVLGTATR